METKNQEENDMYNLLNEALFDLCNAKPNEPIEYISQQLLAKIGQRMDYNKKKTIKAEDKNQMNEASVSKEKVMLSRLLKNFQSTYTIIEKIGGGSSGEVFTCYHNNFPKEILVVKIVYKDTQKPNEVSETNVELLLKLDHTNLVQIYDLIEDSNNMYIVQEYCPHRDLYNFIYHNKQTLSRAQMKEIIRQVLDAISYLHSLGIMHRDLKPENILIKQTEPSFIVKICDFSSVTYIPRNESLTAIVGTPQFMAPEVLQGSYNELSDVWSIGVITYLLIGGKPPYLGKSIDILFSIMNKNFEFLDSHTSEDRKFISQLMEHSLLKRLTAKLARNHPWLKDSEESDIGFGLEALNEMSKFSCGTNLKRSILSYTKVRRLFEDRSNRLHKMFKALDVNNDGWLDAEEITSKFGSFFPGTPEKEKEQIKELISKFDIDGSGRIDYSEFMMMAVSIKSEENKRKLKEVFEFFDVDGDQFITVDDLREIFEDKNVSEVRFEEMIDEFDVDGDRKISLEEFYKIMTK